MRSVGPGSEDGDACRSKDCSQDKWREGEAQLDLGPIPGGRTVWMPDQNGERAKRNKVPKPPIKFYGDGLLDLEQGGSLNLSARLTSSARELTCIFSMIRAR